MKTGSPQDQTFDNTKETADEYHKRGGVTHFVPKGSPFAICKTEAATVGFNKWRFVNCIACLRVRAAIRKVAENQAKFFTPPPRGAAG